MLRGRVCVQVILYVISPPILLYNFGYQLSTLAGLLSADPRRTGYGSHLLLWLDLTSLSSIIPALDCQHALARPVLTGAELTTILFYPFGSV